ncbi:hypothetical protein ABEB36_015024 [Hypothenemus hampei]|uniref:SWIM-type domain-containing protein n=1 Tax=Hypothenemus hampei TaxID=57062 RepID=A0ABD1E679_HYPHA
MLSIIDVMKVSKGYVKPMRSGEELLRSGMIVSVGVKEKKNDVVHVQALVLRTSGVNSKHPAIIEMWIDVSKEYGSRLICDNERDFIKMCDCPAGAAAKCKHIIAVMLYLSRFVNLVKYLQTSWNLILMCNSYEYFAFIRVEESELEDLSCTDIEKQWGCLKAATLKEYEAKPLSEMCHVKGQRDIYVKTMLKVTKEMENRWRINLMKSCPNSEYSLFESSLRSGNGCVNYVDAELCEKAENIILLEKLLIYGSWKVINVLKKLTEQKLQTCSLESFEFYKKHVDVSLEQSIELINAQQGSVCWHKARKVRQTASKARAQYTYYFNKNPDWDKRYQEVFHSTFTGNEDTVRGLRCEALVKDLYSEILGCTILESGLFVRPELPWLSASLDGTIIDKKGNFIRNIEIKAPKEGTRLTATELIRMNAIVSLDENHNVKKNTQHYAQMQLGMLVSGIPECDYLVYSEFGDDLVMRRISFDENYILEICPCLIKVYFEKFLPRMVSEYGSNYNLNL